MQLSSGRGHLAGASAAIFGYSRVDQQIRDTALRFTAEYSKRKVDHAKCTALAKQLEGDINRLVLTDAISASECSRLVDKLYLLMDTVS